MELFAEVGDARKPVSQAAADHSFSNCPSGTESAPNLSIGRPTAQIPIKIAPTFGRRPDISTKLTANDIVSKQVTLKFGV